MRLPKGANLFFSKEVVFGGGLCRVVCGEVGSSLKNPSPERLWGNFAALLARHPLKVRDGVRSGAGSGDSWGFSLGCVGLALKQAWAPSSIRLLAVAGQRRSAGKLIFFLFS